ncbi:hypothetical protein BDQ17DRAFT_1424621 [Cyathus striatus]|nr:hypothetical protein BDQ17DRAFT_1424621 [Cyathus striatus]
MPGGKMGDNEKCFPREKVSKVIILGSGGLSIGQPSEFDYSGLQAIKTLKEEGIYTTMGTRTLLPSPRRRVSRTRFTSSLSLWVCAERNVAQGALQQGICHQSSDAEDSCITVRNMENIDPLGIHTGDSIVVAPLQTLSNSDYNMLRTTAVNVIRHLSVVGECNIQYALNPTSASSKSTHVSHVLPLLLPRPPDTSCFIAAKLGLGIPLNEIRTPLRRSLLRASSPTWITRLLSSSMKSVGKAVSTGPTFEETIQKAIRAIDDSFSGFAKNDYVENIDEELVDLTDEYIFAISTAFHRGYSIEKVWQMTNIDKWFLRILYNIFEMENCLDTCNVSTIPADMLRQAK